MPDLTTILAGALHGANVGCHYEREFDRKSCEPGSARHSVAAKAIVAAIPDVEREALELGLAWLRVQRALSEGWDVDLRTDPSAYSPGYRAWAGRYDSVGRHWDQEYAQGPTPTAALTALAEAVGARR